MTYPDILDTASQVLSRLQDEQPYSVRLMARTANGIFCHVSLQFAQGDLQPAPRGALLDLAYRVGMTEVDLDRDPAKYRVTGKLNDNTVELWA